MKITNKAKPIIEKILEENNCDTLLVNIMQGCCGPSVFLTMGTLQGSEEVTNVNGVSVVFSPEAIERTKEVVIDEKDGKLVLEDALASNC